MAVGIVIMGAVAAIAPAKKTVPVGGSAAATATTISLPGGGDLAPDPTKDQIATTAMTGIRGMSTHGMINLGMINHGMIGIGEPATAIRGRRRGSTLRQSPTLSGKPNKSNKNYGSQSAITKSISKPNCYKYCVVCH